MNELALRPGITVTINQVTLLYKEYLYYENDVYIGKQSVDSLGSGAFQVQNFGPTGNLLGGYAVTNTSIQTFDADRKIVFTEPNPEYTPPPLKPIGFPDHSAIPSQLNASIDSSEVTASANQRQAPGVLFGRAGDAAIVASANNAYQAGDSGGVAVEVVAGLGGGVAAGAGYAGGTQLVGVAASGTTWLAQHLPSLGGVAVRIGTLANPVGFVGGVLASFYAEEPTKSNR